MKIFNGDCDGQPGGRTAHCEQGKFVRLIHQLQVQYLDCGSILGKQAASISNNFAKRSAMFWYFLK